MAQIREELILYDRFTDTFTQYIRLGEKAAGVTSQAKKTVDQFSSSQRTAATSTDTLMRSIKSLIGGYIGLQGLRSLLNLSDTITATTARLDMMNDGLQTTAELNQMIFESAQRSRGSYQQTANLVAKLGTLAGNAFSSNQEIIAFAEQINKQMALSGTTTQEAQAAMLQLTQGLSSGVLRGEELNSVLEQTPMIAQTIANYMGVTTGEMRTLASEGKVTAEVVKNAMLEAAEETNAKFEQMPMTWSQVWTQFQNMAIQALDPVLQLVSLAANNMDTLAPIILGVAVALGVYAAATMAANAATWLSVAANRALIATMMKSPFLWIAVAIGIVVAAIYNWIQSVGGLQTAWLIAKNTVLTAWEEMQYGAARLSTNFQNMFGQMKVGILVLLESMVNGAIDLINKFIAKVNLIPGVAVDPINHVTFAANAAAEELALANNRNANLAGMRRTFDMQQSQRTAEIAARQAQAGVSANSAGYSPYSQIANQLSGISDSVAGIEKSVSMSEEDIKSLVDVAERRYVNNINLTAQTPVINITGQNTGHTAADRQNLANTIRDILIEQVSSGSARTTATAF